MKNVCINNCKNANNQQINGNGYGGICIIQEFIKLFKDVYEVYVWLGIVLIGLFIVLKDTKEIKKVSYRDAKITNMIGWTYIVVSTFLFIAVK